MTGNKPVFIRKFTKKFGTPKNPSSTRSLKSRKLRKHRLFPNSINILISAHLKALALSPMKPILWSRNVRQTGHHRFLTDFHRLVYNLGIAAASGINASANLNFASGQTEYIMGQNPQNQCFIVGFDGNCPEKPHHRSSSCPASGDCNNGQNNGGPNPMVSSKILVTDVSDDLCW